MFLFLFCKRHWTGDMGENGFPSRQKNEIAEKFLGPKKTFSSPIIDKCLSNLQKNETAKKPLLALDTNNCLS